MERRPVRFKFGGRNGMCVKNARAALNSRNMCYESPRRVHGRLKSNLSMTRTASWTSFGAPEASPSSGSARSHEDQPAHYVRRTGRRGYE